MPLIEASGLLLTMNCRYARKIRIVFLSCGLGSSSEKQGAEKDFMAISGEVLVSRSASKCCIKMLFPPAMMNTVRERLIVVGLKATNQY